MSIILADAKERSANFHRRDEDVVEYVKRCKFSDFILDAHNPTVCGNVLDLPNVRPEAPTWIR